MKKFNFKILISLTISAIFASNSYLFVDAEVTQNIIPKSGKINASFTGKLRRIGTTKARIIKYFELPKGVEATDIYNTEAIGIKSTNGEESKTILNTGCFKDYDGNYGAQSFQLKVERLKEINGTPEELKMVKNQTDNIDEEHFKVTSCKTEETTDDGKKFLKITWQIEGYDLDSSTEIILPKFWATEKNVNSDKTE